MYCVQSIYVNVLGSKPVWKPEAKANKGQNPWKKCAVAPKKIQLYNDLLYNTVIKNRAKIQNTTDMEYAWSDDNGDEQSELAGVTRCKVSDGTVGNQEDHEKKLLQKHVKVLEAEIVNRGNVEDVIRASEERQRKQYGKALGMGGKMAAEQPDVKGKSAGPTRPSSLQENTGTGGADGFGPSDVPRRPHSIQCRPSTETVSRLTKRNSGETREGSTKQPAQQQRKKEDQPSTNDPPIDLKRYFGYGEQKRHKHQKKHHAEPQYPIYDLQNKLRQNWRDSPEPYSSSSSDDEQVPDVQAPVSRTRACHHKHAKGQGMGGSGHSANGGQSARPPWAGSPGAPPAFDGPGVYDFVKQVELIIRQGNIPVPQCPATLLRYCTWRISAICMEWSQYAADDWEGFNERFISDFADEEDEVTITDMQNLITTQFSSLQAYERAFVKLAERLERYGQLSGPEKARSFMGGLKSDPVLLNGILQHIPHMTREPTFSEIQQGIRANQAQQLFLRSINRTTATATNIHLKTTATPKVKNVPKPAKDKTVNVSTLATSNSVLTTAPAPVPSAPANTTATPAVSTNGSNEDVLKQIQEFFQAQHKQMEELKKSVNTPSYEQSKLWLQRMAADGWMDGCVHEVLQ
ncbi:hypothetical protein HK104_010792 [Borealophlyctis nickersoniae]|nr:hypothetical protein HK104_010792 [Borealophlyctis nickersoniae]